MPIDDSIVLGAYAEVLNTHSQHKWQSCGPPQAKSKRLLRGDKSKAYCLASIQHNLEFPLTLFNS